MNKYAIEFLRRLIYKVLDLESHLIVFIKEQLSVVIKPVESQIFDSDGGPLVLELSTGTVHDMGNLIHSKELQVLS